MARARAGLAAAEFAILGVLRERPSHGYEVARRFVDDRDLGLVLPLDMSSVYATLKELQERGLIDGHREDVGARPPRTVFQITPDGDRRFDAWLLTPVERLREVRSDLLLKLYFARQVGNVAVARLLDAQADVCRGYAARLSHLRDAAAPESFERLVRESKLGVAWATVAWLEDERARLGS